MRRPLIMNRQKILVFGVNDFLQKFLLLLLLFCLLSIFSFRASGQNSPEITTLEPEKRIERELAGGQKHIFQIDLRENQYARIILEQRGIDVVIRLLDTDGGGIAAEYDNEPRNSGEELIELAVRAAGSFQLTVEPRQKNAETGRYQIHLVDIRQASEKDLSLDETRKLITKANQLWRSGKYSEALPPAERALAIREKELGTENFEVSQALFLLANIWSDYPDYEKSESFYLRAIAMRENSMGKDHISVSLPLNNLAVLYKDKGEYVKAETLLLRVLGIREKELGADHLLVASVLLNLGNVNREKGINTKAEAFYQRALAIREKALGKESLEVAVILNNLANIYEDFGKAEPIYLRVLAIREKLLGPDHPEVGQILYNLAILYSTAGNIDKAKEFGERSLAIFEKRFGDEHPFTSFPLNFLGIIYKTLGDYERSETVFLRSVAIKEKKQGHYHPFLGGALLNLAELYAVKGEIEKAIETQTRANEILEYNVRINLVIGSEQEKLSYLETVSDSENRTLSLNVEVAPASSAATELAATSILQRKGRVLDAMSENLTALRRRFNPQDQLLLTKLNETTTKLSKLIFAETSTMATEEYRKKIREIETERENIESEISRRSAGFYEQTKPITLKSIREAMPENAVLLEIAHFYPVSPKAFSLAKKVPADEAEKARYIVYIIRKNGEVVWKDLGKARLIDAAVSDFRKALYDSKSKNFKEIARNLDSKLMSPIRSLIGDKKQLLISPDGNLNLIPFEALVDETGRFLVENYAVSYLSSGRDLLRMQTPRVSIDKTLVVANPNYGEPPDLTIPAASTKRQSITATRNLTDTYFAPLGGTAQEARAIQAIFPEAVFLTQAQATETAVKNANAPQILHLATHGFFLEESSKAEKTKPENPLLRSGLAFAGANKREKGERDDGILTALEASGLNLWGTKLVVLSACDTGLGEVKNGEGVYGLRRAFVLAGTESLVMSLWSVSDYVTREMMTNYYKNLKSGMGRGEALRAVQLEMLKKPNRQHPFFWASFIQTGEWANLAGKR